MTILNSLVHKYGRGRLTIAASVISLLVIAALIHLSFFANSYRYFYSSDSTPFPLVDTPFARSGPGLEIIPPYSPHPDPRTLPLLAWVIIATPSAITKHGDLLTQIACYCLNKGIPFHLEHQVIVDDRHLVSGRHASVAKYLKRYQWVFASDADTLVADSSIDLRHWIDPTSKGSKNVDVIFNDRRNGEVCACAYFVKNSPGGWTFLRRWVAWADNGRHSTDWDNGDLGEMITAGLRRGLPNNRNYTGRITAAEEEGFWEHGGDEQSDGCISKSGEVWGWPEYISIFIGCLKDFLHSYRTEDDRTPFWEVDLWSWTDVLPQTRMRTYKVLSGFNRWGLGEGTSERTWDGVRLPGDFLISGKGLEKFVEADSASCMGGDWRMQPSWSMDEAREVLISEGGVTWWPGCWEGNKYVCKRPHE
ncbi:hypothetical protein CI109_105426 [Kwoniella shandongensis]|uniref:Uncharacterized protein n=1 Tax=Kwoniella shandongensis TaxID=1734106 RepID=A0A5M6C2A7_9TREE|nr:uncharacterized protein CI109_002147 [Kwoniella shandongensis]KAA5529257.1 hypothetical protein CI109_002147 [Kwoniella shandongensis]